MAKKQTTSVAHVFSRPSSSVGRPPIVAVLGHVDHGKTTLLDAIRKTDLASREHGGITQHIGAYQVQVKGRFITFIDTPGHEAFAKMRSRGACAADIAILVVAADDSVKPQTVESIEQIKKAGIPMVVAINKVDLPGANIDRVKQDLAKHGVQVEGFGGEVPFVLVSAKQGTGLDDLLDLVLLVGDMQGLTGDPSAPVAAVVIETRIDKGKGMVATVIVKKGTLAVGMQLYDGAVLAGKVRASFDEFGKPVSSAGPGKPVEVLGFSILPPVGSLITSIAQEEASTKATEPKAVVGIAELPDYLKPIDTAAERRYAIVLKADTTGSLEAIVASLPKQIDIVQMGVGDVAERDILFAKSSSAIVVGFNVSCRGAVVKLAEAEKVTYRTYKIIYELLGELGEVVAGLKEVLREERELGVGQIIAEFPFERERIAGTKVASGRLARGDRVKIMRGETEVARAKIKSLRHGKEDITKADIGIECGVLFDQKVDFTIGDGIIAVTIG